MAASIAAAPPREQLLDAADVLIQDAAWSDISMAAIAEQAGVSRQTLYNEFGSRDVFAQAFVLRAADRFITAIEQAIELSADDPLLALRNGFEQFLELADADPMVRMIVLRDAGAEELLALFTTRGGPVVELARMRLAARFIEIWPEVEIEPANLLAETVVRLAISHASLPVDDPAVAAADVSALIAPFIAVHLPSAVAG